MTRYFENINQVASFLGLDEDEKNELENLIEWNGETPIHNYKIEQIFVEDEDYLDGRFYRLTENA